MSFWILIWVLLSLTLLGFLGWSLFVLYQQKTTWKAFAKKHKLSYIPNSLMQTPQVSGVMHGYKVSLFASEHVSENMRGTRKLTAIEVSLDSLMPFDGAIGNGGMVPIVNSLEFRAEVRPKHEKWNSSFIAAGDSSHALSKYLTDERTEILARTMSIRNAWVIFIFRNDAMLLRLDTPEPISNLKELEKLITLLCKAAQVLELGKGESAILKSEANKKERRDRTVDIDVDKASAAKEISLELEEDEPDSEAEPVEKKADTADGAQDEKPDTENS